MPVITLGCTGTFIGVTASNRAVPMPQAFDGVRVILPAPALAPTVTVAELVVPPAVCVHPGGKVQV